MIRMHSYAAGFDKINNSFRYVFYALFFLLLSGIMYGCIGGKSPRSVYYVLSSSQKLSALKTSINGYSLGVGPVTIPEFLKRPQIVTRPETNVLNINEFHRWANSLESQIADNLVANFATRLNTSRVISYPWARPFSPEYQLYIEFKRFDGNLAGSITLDVICHLVDIKHNKKVFTKPYLQIESIRGKGYKAYVTALNTALEKISEKIAHSILLLSF